MNLSLLDSFIEWHELKCATSSASPNHDTIHAFNSGGLRALQTLRDALRSGAKCHPAMKEERHNADTKQQSLFQAR